MDAIVPYSNLLTKPYDREAFWSAAAGNKVDQARTVIQLAKMANNLRKTGIHRREKRTKYSKSSYASEERSGRDAKSTNGNRKAMVYQRSVPIGLQKLAFVNITYPQVNNLTSDKTRLSNEIFCSGIKLCMSVYNNAAFPVEFHWAVVRLRNKEFQTPIAPKTELLSDFFRNPIDVQDRETDFNETSGIYEPNQKCFPINPEKFDILTHKKFMMGGKLSTISVNDSRHIKKIEKWFRINKKLQFETPDSNNPNYPFLLVGWTVSCDPNDYSTTLTPWRWETYITPYFRSKT